MTTIETSRLILRPCREEDRELFYELSSDPAVLEFFPFSRSRKDADAIFSMIGKITPEPGFDFLVAVLKHSGEAIGFSGLSRVQLEPHLPRDAVEIGWRLSARHWGNGYATEAGAALIRQAFTVLSLKEILSIAVHDNRRVLSVMRKIGMQPHPFSDFDHPQIPETHPHLKRHVVYRLRAAEWRAQQARHIES
ncbi:MULTISPECIES: GNAT family N-acetyltransferase [unclassified Rhizobium]|jgi:RimJ/RimL family protein N-acetyltransferase|uniref:GNAT family N-acetyltransferase n=1 Tax=unclassified Rhizobium TaxID=2613769 RepID=UPI0006471238|nr:MULTISPECIES: GNAT family N-acetyltransferase [unclassified Rhizobium]MBN8952303.1 GNAT family N-acetyltransferase [Rhizobium tropici]OJY79756.1 MAG: GNAT family N-acetyltransferase [Rhizobium sp. 60-20]RKD66906.1 RimJ/RimL family protein N-acetyltransferase [Rhizobium sp. WW_1]